MTVAVVERSVVDCSNVVGIGGEGVVVGGLVCAMGSVEGDDMAEDSIGVGVIESKAVVTVVGSLVVAIMVVAAIVVVVGVMINGVVDLASGGFPPSTDSTVTTPTTSSTNGSSVSEVVRLLRSSDVVKKSEVVVCLLVCVVTGAGEDSASVDSRLVVIACEVVFMANSVVSGTVDVSSKRGIEVTVDSVLDADVVWYAVVVDVASPTTNNSVVSSSVVRD